MDKEIFLTATWSAGAQYLLLEWMFSGKSKIA